MYVPISVTYVMIDYAKKVHERIEDKVNEPSATKRTIITTSLAKISQQIIKILNMITIYVNVDLFRKYNILIIYKGV